MFCLEQTFSRFYSEDVFEYRNRPSDDTINELNKKMEILNEEIKSLKQNHETEVSTLKETAKREKENLLVENTRWAFLEKTKVLRVKPRSHREMLVYGWLFAYNIYT